MALLDVPDVAAPGPSQEPIRRFGYGIDFSPISANLKQLGATLDNNDQVAQRNTDQSNKLDALAKFTQFEGVLQARIDTWKQIDHANDPNFVANIDKDFQQRADTFRQSISPDLQAEYEPRIQQLRNVDQAQARAWQFTAQGKFAETTLDNMLTASKVALNANPTVQNFDSISQRMHDAVTTAPGLTAVDRAAKIAIIDRDLGTGLYGSMVQSGGNFGPVPAGADQSKTVGSLIRASASRLGIDPTALTLAMLYETQGTLNPGMWGGKDGNYMGLIQFGPDERTKYGVSPNDTIAQQLPKVEQFLKDRGLQPGMGLRDIYSTINAGRPGMYGASDGPGWTVDGHVDDMLHSPDKQVWRDRAAGLVGGKLDVGSLDNDPRFYAVTVEDRIAAQQNAIKSAQQAQVDSQKAYSQQYTDNLNTLLTNIGDKKANSVDFEQFRQQYPHMPFADIERTQNLLTKQFGDQQTLMDARAHNAGGEAWDPNNSEHKKQIDAIMGGTDGVAALNNKDQNFVTHTLFPYVAKTGMIGPQMAGTLAGMTRSQDTTQAKFALDTLSQLQDLSPDAYSKLPDQVKSDVSLWRSSRDAITQDQALANIRGVPDATQRAMQGQLKDEAVKFISDSANDPSSKFMSSFNSWYSKIPLAGRAFTYYNQSPVGIVNEQMTQEFKDNFIQEYQRDGNKEAALERAKQTMSNNWGPNTVGGGNTIMKYPPQMFYKQYSGSYDWIDAQVRSELKLLPDTQYFPVADSKTQQEAIAWRNAQADPNSHPQPPAYQIYTMQNGQLRLALNDKGLPYRMYFEPSADVKELDMLEKQLSDASSRHNAYMSDLQQQLPGGSIIKAISPEVQQQIDNDRGHIDNLTQQVADKRSAMYPQQTNLTLPALGN